MSILSGVSDFFGLDIGSTAVRMVQLRRAGSSKALVRYAYVPIPMGLSQSDSKADQEKLGQVIADLLNKSGVTTKNATVGLPSRRVFTTVTEVDRLSKQELAKSIRFQVDSVIPTPIDETKFDWTILGDSATDPNKIEVLLSSVPNNYVERILDIVEHVGINVIAFEPDSIALCRALLAPGTLKPQLIIDIGSTSTDLIIVMNDAPRLTRAINIGMATFIKTASQNLNVDQKQAEELIFKFGLTKDKLEGQAYDALMPAVDPIVQEIEKSIKFFSSKYPSQAIERIIVTGGASSMPGFPVHLSNKLNLMVEIGNSWRNVAYDVGRQTELSTVSNHFAVAVGLAERNND